MIVTILTNCIVDIMQNSLNVLEGVISIDHKELQFTAKYQRGQSVIEALEFKIFMGEVILSNNRS